MNSTLRPGEKPALQVRITPAGTTAFAIAMAEHAAPLETALRQRPADLSGLLSMPGLPTQLRRLRDALDATLRELAQAERDAIAGNLSPRPFTDPLPPTPKPQPRTHITK